MVCVYEEEVNRININLIERFSRERESEISDFEPSLAGWEDY